MMHPTTRGRSRSFIYVMYCELISHRRPLPVSGSIKPFNGYFGMRALMLSRVFSWVRHACARGHVLAGGAFRNTRASFTLRLVIVCDIEAWPGRGSARSRGQA